MSFNSINWFHCPTCGQKLLKIDKTKKIAGVYIKCKRCRQEVEIKEAKN